MKSLQQMEEKTNAALIRKHILPEDISNSSGRAASLPHSQTLTKCPSAKIVISKCHFSLRAIIAPWSNSSLQD